MSSYLPHTETGILKIPLWILTMFYKQSFQILIEESMPVADSFWYLAKLVQLCKV